MFAGFVCAYSRVVFRNRYVQEISASGANDQKLLAVIDQLNAVFPQDLVEYYSPGYAERLYEQHFGDEEAAGASP